mmetsp:Transcript_26449/g.53644  ORF Transcript_26449/g.53644 Transcript_26449/m.53644 type:complete len:229 (+) Transcript_26449:51-737(+)
MYNDALQHMAFLSGILMSLLHLPVPCTSLKGNLEVPQSVLGARLLPLSNVLGGERPKAQKRSMTKSPTSSAAPSTQSTAASAPPAMASPASVATSPRSAMVASQPSSAMCSPRRAPPTAKPPTTSAPPPTAATLAPVPHFFFSFSSLGSTGLYSDEISAAGKAEGSPGGIGTSIAWPTLAVGGTLTAMNCSLFLGWGTWMVVPGAPGGTVMQKDGPAGAMGFSGAFHL